MAARALFPIASDMVVISRQYTTIVTTRRIFDQNSVMTLTRCRRFVTCLTSVWNWIEFSINRLYRKFDTAVGIMHFLHAVLADCHVNLLNVPIRRLLEVRRVGKAAQQKQQQRLLCVHAVFGLIKDDGLRAVEDGVCDFRVAARGQAVHEDGAAARLSA